MAYDPFSFFFPTRICFGMGESAHTVSYLQKYMPCKKVFIVTYADFVLPILNPTLSALQEAGIEYELYNKAIPNPRAQDVDAGAEAYLSSGAQAILGIGGGSVIDTAKAIALLAANPSNGGIWDYVSYVSEPKNPAVPLGLVVSIASTGSESNESFVLTDLEGKEKMIYSIESLRPRFSVCDPALSFTLPKKQTALGAADIFSHVLEQYLHNQEGVELSDDMCLSVLKTVVKYAPVALEDPTNAAARSGLMWSSILAMSRLLGVGHQENWICHMLEHAVSARYDIPHAAGMTAITPAYLRYIADEDSTGKLAKLSSEVFSSPATKEAAIASVKSFFASLGLPTDLKSALGFDVDTEALHSLAVHALPWGSMEAGLYKSFTQEDAVKVFTMALGASSKEDIL